MFFTLKINTKTWNVKWCPLTTMWMEIQHHSRSKAGDFTWASCGTESMTKADVEPDPDAASPQCWAPSRGASCTAQPGERDTSLCPAWPWWPGHTRQAAQRWQTPSVPVCYGVLWPRVVRKTEQTGKLQTTPDKQMETCKNKPIKKIDWVRCNAAFVSKTLPCKSAWNSTTRFAKDFQRSYSSHRKKKKDPHPMEPIWT